MPKSQVRVLIADDSPTVCKILTEILSSDPQIIVVGTALSGREAVEMTDKLKPDLLCLDIAMPVMDGFEVTKQVMAYTPTPILIISSSILKEGMDKAFKAISFGALDVIDKRDFLNKERPDFQRRIDDFIAKVKFLANIEVVSHPLAKIEKRKPVEMPPARRRAAGERIVGLVASTGGPRALVQILQRFGGNFPCPIVIVQHISPGFTEGLAEWLAAGSSIPVVIPGDGERLKPGTAYVAPSGLQMKVGFEGRIKLSDDPPVDGFKPSGNVLLESVGRVYGENAIGVILTGMGADGARGMKAIKENKGLTIAEDEKTAVVFGMPRAAIEMGIIDLVIPLDKIAAEIIRELTV